MTTSLPWCGHLALIGVVALLAGCGGARIASSTKHFPEKTGFVPRQVAVDGVMRSYWLFIPPDYTPYRNYPAVLFLHGFFEGGNGGTNVLSAGLGPVIARSPQSWPFITVFPQSEGDWRGEAHDRLAMAALNDAQRELMIDPNRVILAGLSFGGSGVWEIGARHPDRFAALVPMSGQSQTELAEKLASTPVWAFASEGDPIISSSNSAEMCRAIQAQGGRAILTQLPGNEHDCWAIAVQDSSVVRWMLNQRRTFNMAASHTQPGQAWGRLRMWNE